MDTILRDIEKGLRDLRDHLTAIRTIRHPEAAVVSPTYFREPGWRALNTLPGTYFVLLANMELLLSSVCDQVAPEASARHFANTLATRESGYWSQGAIANGVADLAVELRVLSDRERSQLLAEQPWDQREFRIVDVVSGLEGQIRFLTGLVAELKKRAAENREIQNA